MQQHTEMQKNLSRWQPKNDGVCPIREVFIEADEGVAEVHLKCYAEPLMMDLLGETEQWLADKVLEYLKTGKTAVLMELGKLYAAKADGDPAAIARIQQLGPIISAIESTLDTEYVVTVELKEGMPLNPTT